jgi:transcription initiation factor TFIIIB Brf1 subunit/transcription initiation factor TFIIB
MIKCPNCGSTTKVEYVPNPPRTAIIERIICSCGCITTATYKLVKEETRTADGAQVGHRKELNNENV